MFPAKLIVDLCHQPAETPVIVKFVRAVQGSSTENDVIAFHGRNFCEFLN